MIRHHAAGTHQLIQKVYQDRLCWQASVSVDDDMGGRFGDAPEHPRKRAQLMDDSLAHEGDVRPYPCATLFPAEWKMVGLTTIISLHQTLADGDPVMAPPIEMYADGDSLSWVRRSADRSWSEIYRCKIIPEQWDDWDLRVTHSADTGSIVLIKNGIEVATFRGQTRFPYDKGTYFLLGPYAFRGFPDGVNYRRMYIQLNEDI